MEANRYDIADLLKCQKSEIEQERIKLDLAEKDLKQRELIWEGLTEAVDNNCSAAIVNIFKQHSDFFKRFRTEKSEEAMKLEKLYRDSVTIANETTKRFISLFPKACNEAGIEIDANSRHPKYSIKEFIHIEVDERNMMVKIEPRNGYSKLMPLDIKPLVTYIHDELHRLFFTERKSGKLLSGILKAYKAVCREEKKEVGDEIPLRRVINRFSKNWKQMKYDELNVDLGKLINAGKISVDGYRLTLNHTRDQRQGLLISGLEKGGYMGYISFKKETK